MAKSGLTRERTPSDCFGEPLANAGSFCCLALSRCNVGTRVLAVRTRLTSPMNVHPDTPIPEDDVCPICDRHVSLLFNHTAYVYTTKGGRIHRGLMHRGCT